MYGGFAGGQAGPIRVPDSLTDEQVLFLSDIFPTGYQAAENCNIQSGDTGSGPAAVIQRSVLSIAGGGGYFATSTGCSGSVAGPFKTTPSGAK